MMENLTATTRNLSGQLPHEPRVIKLTRSRSKRNQGHHSSKVGTRASTTIHTSIGLSRRADIMNDRVQSIIIGGSRERSNNQLFPMSENRTISDLVLLDSQSLRSQDARHDTAQTSNRSDLRMTDGLSSRMNFPMETQKRFNQKNTNRRKVGFNFCRCSRLCIFCSIFAAIILATVIAVILMSLLNNTRTTTKMTTVTTTTATTDTSTTATTETTTITYVPTGIYALQIPTCATWNQTGITVAGNANGTAGTDAGSLSATVSIFVDNNYTLYVCDRNNNRIMKYPVNATIGTVVAGNGTVGSAPTELNSPKGVAVDQMGAVIVADSANYRIQRFPLGSLVGTTIAINSSASLLGQTRDLHIDVNNGVYVTDSDYSRIVKYYPNNLIGDVLAGSSGPGSAASQLLQPFGNFMDGNQTLYIADSGNNRVQKWPAGATTGITIAGVTASPGSNLTLLNNPMAVIADNNGYVYIADSANNRIVRWTDNYAAGGTCIVGCTGSTGVAATQLKGPRDLKFDASGNLYVSDQGNNRVQKFMIQITPNCSATGSG